MNKTDRQNRIRLALRIILPIACILWLAFILSNSLQTGAQSAAQSTTVVDTVQDVAQVIAPDSPIANATGEAYDRLHITIRDVAHFLQFMVLGTLFGWCYFAYTFKIRYFYIPVFGILFVPVIDEFVQHFVADRGSELADVLTDTCGGFAGIVVAIITVLIGMIVYKIKTRPKEDKNQPKMPKSHPMYGLK